MTAYTTSQYNIRYTLKNYDGTPYGLVGKELEMRIGIGGGARSIIPINTSNGRLVIVDAAAGIFNLILTGADMQNFIARTYQFEVGWSNSPSGYFRLFGGSMSIRQGVPA